MALSLPATPTWEVCITIVQAFAIGSTIIRLVHRWRTSRMWWDDWVVLLPLVIDCLNVSLMWVDVGKPSLNNTGLLFSRWFSSFMFFIIVWVSRVSLAFSIARIFPPNHVCRRFALGLALSFLILCITAMAISTGECYNSSAAWYTSSFKDCALKHKGGIIGLYVTMAFEFVADIALIVSPLTMLWKIKLPIPQRRLVLTLFSSSVLSVLASVAFFTSLFLTDGLSPKFGVIVGLTSQLQSAVSLLVCNLLVVTMLFYSMLQRRKNRSRANSQSPSDEKRLAEEQTSANHPRPQDPSHANFTLTNTMSRLASPHGANEISMTFTSIYEDSTPQSSARRSPSRSTGTQSDMSFPSFGSDNIAGLSCGLDIPPWSFPKTNSNVTASGRSAQEAACSKQMNV